MKNYDLKKKCLVPSGHWRTYFKRDFLLFIFFELTLAFLGKRVSWFSVAFVGFQNISLLSGTAINLQPVSKGKKQIRIVMKVIFVGKNSTASAGN